MFTLKICGITSPDDAFDAVSAGAEALGLNFYRHSSRCVDESAAAKIVAVVPTQITKVGVFVNGNANEISRLFESLRLDLIQLHGDEPPEFVRDLGTRPVMKAFGLAGEGDGLAMIADYAERCADLGCPLYAVLVDSHVPGQYGGSGVASNWNPLANWRDVLGSLPLVLAGGLTPANVAQAIRLVRPTGVDTASGVESSPGHKDAALVQAFVREASLQLK